MMNLRHSGRSIASAGIAAALTVSALALGVPAMAADPITPTASTWLEYAGEADGNFGSASRTGCDINADGIDDTVAGDFQWSRAGYNEVGAGYVLLGSRTPSSGDVADPASGAIRIDGPAVTTSTGISFPWIGAAVSCLGDVNKDGIDDFVLGSNSRHFHKAVVIFGSRTFESIDLEQLGSHGFWISDPGAVAVSDSDNFGSSVAAAGDVNGDGYADIVVGDLLADYNGRDTSGRVWVIAGSASPRDVDVQVDTDRVLFTIDGALKGSRLGTAEALGDVNGDGRDDLVVSAYTATPWGDSVAVPGAAYVVFGQESNTAVDLASLGTGGFAIYGGFRARDRLGMSVAAAGDVNGDGLADLIVGADGVSNAATGDRTGGAAVVFGSASTATVITEPTATDDTVYTCASGAVVDACTGSTKVNRGYWIDGDVKGARVGVSVAGLGDVNGDGVPDQAVGGTAVTSSGTPSRTWIVYGQRTARQTIEVDALTPTQGTLFLSGKGSSLVSVGDHDANGVADVLVGGSNAVSIGLLGALNTSVTLTGATSLVEGSGTTLTASATALVPAAKAALAGTITISENGTALAECTDLAVTADVTIDCAVTGLSTGAHAYTAAFTPADASAYATSTVNHTVTATAKPVPAAPKPTTPTTPARTSLAAKPKATVAKVRAGKRQVAVVRLGKLANGAWPSGKVKVRYAGKVTTVWVKSAQRGVVRVQIAKKATYTKDARPLKVQFLGNATTAASKIVTIKVRVTRR